MKAPLVILCAVGLVGGAGAWVWRQQAAESAASLAEVKARPSAGAAAGTVRRPAAAVAKAAGQPDRAASQIEAELTAYMGAVRLGAAASPLGPAVLGDGELQRRAARVEQEANHDLAQLVGLLGIDEAQQDRIFETLVRHAPGWVPAMQAVGAGEAAAAVGAGGSAASAVGSDGGTLLDAIAADLTPDQQVELANEELDRQEWWEAIIEQLLPASEVPAVGGGADAVVPAAETPGPADSKVGEEPMVLD